MSSRPFAVWAIASDGHDDELACSLLVIIGVALTVLWSAAAVWMLRDLDRGLQRTLDERLAMSARMVSGLLAQSSFSPGEPPITASGSHIVPGSRGMACQVRTLRGDIVATTRDHTQSPMQADTVGYQTLTLDGQRWRTVLRQVPGTVAALSAKRGMTTFHPSFHLHTVCLTAATWRTPSVEQERGSPECRSGRHRSMFCPIHRRGTPRPRVRYRDRPEVC